MPAQGARTALLILLCLLCLTLQAAAQSNLKVTKIEVEGNTRTTESLIMGVSSVDIGSPLSMSDIAESIRRLYRLGIFSDVSLEAEEDADGLTVYIIVKELPKLSGLEFKGNKKIKSKDLKKKLGLGVGGYISPFLTHDKKVKIAEQYAEKGYFQAVITPLLEYSSDSTEAILTYEIEEKSKVKVSEVIITGTERLEPSKLVGKMRNRKRGFLKSSDFAQEKFEEDLEKVVAEMRKRGFVDAHMVSDSISIDTVINRMTIYLEVYEGPKYYFGKVRFEENEKFDSTLLIGRLKFEEGKTFNEEKYEESLYELYSVYQEIGHLHVQIQDERTTRADSLIDITYRMTEGLPSKINLVKILGNTKTKEKVIRREISTMPGQVFSRARLIRSVRDVMALNYFAQVIPTPVNLPNGDVDVEFMVEEKQTGQISAGAGYNSQDKVVGTIGMGIPNFRGNGQTVSFNVDFGSRRNSVILSFTEPWMFGRPTLLGLDAYTTNRRWFSDYTEGRQGGSVRLGRRLRWPDNYTRIFASYRLERNRFHDFDDFFIESRSFKRIEFYDTDNIPGTNADSIAFEESVVNILDPFPGSVLQYRDLWQTTSRFSFTITRDARDLPQFATKGSQLSYQFENTGGPLGGFWRYQKHSMSVAKFVPLFWGMSISSRVQYGVTTSPAGDDRISLTDRFTPGGTAFDGMIRGYDDGTITPDSLISLGDSLIYFTGNPGESLIPDSVSTSGAVLSTRVRGKYMLVSNIEIQLPIVDQQIYGLLFFDAGNSWLHYNDIKPFSDMFTSTGVGFRIVVPGIGLIGFDFARRLRAHRGEGLGWKPVFQFGSTFR